MPHFCANFRSNSFASSLIRILVDFFMLQLYRTSQQLPRGYAPMPKPQIR
jgi:hypothetical protein